MSTQAAVVLPPSVLVKNQKITKRRMFYRDGNSYRIVAEIRHDDQCGNGHNTFSITASIDKQSKTGRWSDHSGGCLHDEVAKHFPELPPFIRWHLTSADGPMHYIANARYWAGYRGYCDGKPNSPPNAKHLRSVIVFGAVPQWDDGREPEKMGDAELTEWLNFRLSDLMTAFKRDVESLGLVY